MAREQERAELHRTIWQIANDLRGSVDGWDFKNYVLGILFYRFISENITKYINEEEAKAGNTNFNYADISDADAELGRAVTVAEKGFYILPSQLFVNVRKRAASDPDLNETLSEVFNAIDNSAKGADSEDDMKGLLNCQNSMCQVFAEQTAVLQLADEDFMEKFAESPEYAEALAAFKKRFDAEHGRE